MSATRVGQGLRLGLGLRLRLRIRAGVRVRAMPLFTVEVGGMTCRG